MAFSDFIAPIGAFVGEGLNMVSTAITNKRNRDFQRDQWDKTNLYNSPLEQRKRMEAAGFNPNLMYGHGTVANTAAPVNLPDAISPKMDLKNVTAELTAYQNLRNMKATQKQIESQTELNHQARQKSILDQQGQETANRMASAEYARLVGKTPVELEGMKLGNTLTGEDIQLRKVQQESVAHDIALKAMQGRWMPVEKATSMKQMLSNIDFTNANTAKQVFLNSWLPNDKKYQLAQIMQQLDLNSVRRGGIEADTEIRQFEARLKALGFTVSQIARLTPLMFML